jgi:hypothetical protein
MGLLFQSMRGAGTPQWGRRMSGSRLYAESAPGKNSMQQHREVHVRYMAFWNKRVSLDVHGSEQGDGLATAMMV